MSCRSTVLVAVLMASAACAQPSFDKTPPDAPFEKDAGPFGAPASLVDAGGHAPPPGVPTTPLAGPPQAGPSKPGTATTAAIGGFGTGSQPRSAGDLTVHEDGFDSENTLCTNTLCATGRFEP